MSNVPGLFGHHSGGRGGLLSGYDLMMGALWDMGIVRNTSLRYLNIYILCLSLTLLFGGGITIMFQNSPEAM